MIDGFAADLLGGHVRDRAEDRAGLRVRAERGHGLRLRRRHQLGDAEIEDLEPPVAGAEEVLRFEVAVDDALAVRGAEALRELQRELRCFLRRKRALPDAFRERHALEELGDDVRLALPVSDVVDVENVRMIERARRARLLLEPAQRLFAAEAGDEHLDRDLAAELVVEGDHDPAHAALPQLALDLVSPGDEQRRARLVVQTAPRVQRSSPVSARSFYSGWERTAVAARTCSTPIAARAREAQISVTV